MRFIGKVAVKVVSMSVVSMSVNSSYIDSVFVICYNNFSFIMKGCSVMIYKELTVWKKSMELVKEIYIYLLKSYQRKKRTDYLIKCGELQFKFHQT